MNSDSPWALVTGASGGIGQSLVEEFVNDGYQVIATDISLVESLKRENVVPIELDLIKLVKDQEYADEFYQKVKTQLGSSRIKALINNAAIQILSPSEKLTRDDWNTSLNVNLLAPFFMTQLFLKDLEASRGAVVNVSSIHATQTKKDFVAYATSKAAISSMTRNMAVDLGGKVKINAIEPAAVSTSMLIDGFVGKEEELKLLKAFHPIGRIAEPREIAELAVFLCSDKAGFLHGACISASGGIQASLSDPIFNDINCRSMK